MSYVNKSILKGNLDPTIAFFVSDVGFTTGVTTIEAVSQYLAYIKEFRIVNNDKLNSLTYVQGSLSGVVKTVPPSSEVVVTGWESFVQITPNNVSGSGFIEMDLVNLTDAKK